MGSLQAHEPQKLYIETPCIPSEALSRAAGCNIFLKLENLQPSGSFKSRGIGSMMHRALRSQPGETAHFYCSSGGNAGLACATAASVLRQPCTVVVPVTTAAHMIAKLRLLGAIVHQIGESWYHADSHLRTELLAQDAVGVYVPPFDHPHVWEGASTIVDELYGQAGGGSGIGVEMDGIVCNCGGGGLLNGIMEGVERNFNEQQQRRQGDQEKKKKKRPKVLVVETEGAASLDASVRAGRLVSLDRITSIATSLGALRVSERTFRWVREAGGEQEGEAEEKGGEKGYLRNMVVTDAEAVMGSVRFANDARMLVEVACGATIAPVYNGGLRRALGEGLGDDEWGRMNVVLVVCGGSNVSLEILRGYQERFGIE